jgi:hypothetical protein
MRTKLVLIIPLLASMIGMFAIVGVTSANAQNMSTPESNMTSMSNATMSGNMTGGNTTIGNMTGGNAGNMTSPTNMTTP